jgi:glutamine amidotransferase
MNHVAVIDYGMGNLHSVAKAIESVDVSAKVEVTGDASRIMAADRIVFPGVGAIRDCMAEIRRLGVDSMVNDALAAHKPVLAICVGMQALMDSSAENGHVGCLGIIPGEVKRFGGAGSLLDADGRRLKVPHMGWNQVRQTLHHPLWHGIADGNRFYFVHSFFVEPLDGTCVAGQAEYGHKFTAALAKDSLFAVQFHPEKSQHSGLQLLRNFLQWDGRL